MKFVLRQIVWITLILNSTILVAQDDCGTATTITPGASCTYTTFNLAGSLTKSATAVSGCNSGSIVDDGWIKFTATTTQSTIQYINTNRDAALYAYSGTCPGSLTQIGCADNVFGQGTESLTLTTVNGTTYFVRIARMSGNSTQSMSGSVCVVASNPPANDNPCSATSLTVNSSPSFTTYTNVGASATTGVTDPGCASYNGNDVWFSAVVPSSGTLTITTEVGVMTDGGMAFYTGTCGSLTLVGCSDDGYGSSGYMPQLNISCLAAGTVVYIRFWDYGGSSQGTFQIAAVNPGGSSGPPANDEPCAATALTVNAACTFSSYTNQCASATSGVTDPGCANYLGGDVWFTVTVPLSGMLAIDSREGVNTDGGMAIYSGTCSALTLISCDDNLSNNGNMPYLMVSGQTPGATLFVRFWENGNDNNGTFSLCVMDPCPNGVPDNDACADAIELSLSVPVTGNISCAGATGEPANPSCWTNGATELNTVWYWVAVPASGKLSIRTQLGTLTNTQIEVFSGSCGALTSVGCSNDISMCGNTQQWSEVVLTGLTPNAIYYIRVDGYASMIGDFVITAINGNNSWPISPGQDCGAAFPVCSSSITVGDPGFIGSGNVCDYPGNSGGCSTGSCIVVGERNSVWYSFTSLNAGALDFVITPNIPVDYDWALYDVTGLANPCSTIGTGTLAPLRCSYWGGTGPTGLGTTGTETCDGTSGTLDGYATPYSIPAANKNYLLFISNYSTTTFVGYNLNFGASPINYNASSSMVWTGAATTSWNNTANWGGCNVPDCNKDALIYGGSAVQPVITNGQTYYCRNLTIQAGASLTLRAGASLYICGNFINYGVLNAAPTSNIYFHSNATQTLQGAMTGSNQFGNLSIVKSGGTATLIENLDISGNLTLNTTNNATFSLNSQYVTLAGNLVNTTSSLVVPDGTTLEFLGTANQSYTHGPTPLELKNVIVNKPSGSVTLNSDMVIASNGLLTLTLGKISTGATYLTKVLNTSSASVLGGSVGSYVEGNLFRKLSGVVGTYNFPVGNAAKGYQLGSVEFTSATTATELTVRFDSWVTVPNGPVSSECQTANYSLLPLLNNGYWTFTPSPLAPSGNYNITLSSRNQTNASAIGGFTVVKSINSGSSWMLDGTCVISSTASSASRTGLSDFGQFGVGQVSSPLPIELISFTAAEKDDHNLLEWVTLAEVNNEVFTLERSSNGNDFYAIGTVPGAGNSKVVLSYSFKDMKPLSGVNYYRLRQTDYDGTSTTSRIIAIRRHGSGLFNVIASPNPSKGIFNLEVSTSTTGMYKLKVTDASGKGIIEDQVEISGNQLKLPLDLTSFQSGLYNLMLEEPISGENIVIRIVRQ